MFSSTIKTMYNIFLLLLFFILPPSFSLATEPSIGFDHFSIKDGLPHYSVRIILQDSQGYLWIGTEGGLARYDGYSFRVFTHNPEVPSSLSDNFVYAITEDRKGYLWVGTIGGGLIALIHKRKLFNIIVMMIVTQLV